jgi:hypothetical protein
MLPFRILPRDLDQLGSFLFGPRWQTALAHAIHRSPRLVRRWMAGERKPTRHSVLDIEELIRTTQDKRVRNCNAAFLHMVAGLSNPEERGRLLDPKFAGLRVADDQIRRAAIVVPFAVEKQIVAASPVLDFAPHDHPDCLRCELYRAATNSIKSQIRVALLVAGGAIAWFAAFVGNSFAADVPVSVALTWGFPL